MIEPSAVPAPTSPVFSVVIATFNRADLLLRAVTSVLRQEFRDFELIVIDDGSTDHTARVIQGMADPRVVYVSQQNKGRSAARNRGARMARGNLLTFLDSDDEVMTSWLGSFREVLGDERASVVCCGARIRIDRPHLRSHSEMLRLPKSLEPLFTGISGLFLTGTFALKTSLFLQLGGYEESLAFSENTDLSLRLISRCLEGNLRIACIDLPLMIFHNQRPPADATISESRLAAAEFMLHRHGGPLSRALPFKLR